MIYSQGKNRISKIFSKAVPIILAAFVAFGIFSQTFASGPAFDVFPIAYNGAQNTDYPLLDARNSTQNGSFSTSQSDHDNGVAGSVGDIIEFIVYYHNGAANAAENTARNVRVLANLPSGTSQTQTVSASISADNVTTVNSSSRGGNVTVNISGSAQPLEYVAGSTKWFPSRSTQGQALPDGIVSGGVTLGDIQGCWEFSGFVKFQVKAGTAQSQATLSIQKSVKNLTNSGNFSTSITANPLDSARFQITVQALSGNVANLIIRDILPSTLTYTSNTAKVNGVSISDSSGLLGSGYNFGTLNQNNTVTVEFDAVLASASYFGSNTQTVTNTANARGDNVPTVQATANINVSGQVLNSSFQQSKSAYNQTQGVAAQSVQANPGDIINYTLTYQNTGGVNLTNIVITDDLSGILPYADVINAGD
ncbi:MAG: hypothetical protein AAB686_00730, partial [Patescibacteria group bacterium]